MKLRAAKYFLILTAAAFLLNFKMYGQTIIYRTLPGSRMWIDGTSTLNDYTCKTNEVEGYAQVNNLPDLNDGTSRKDKAFLTVTVQSLNCGLELMNEDMYNAMKSKKYPFIKYELLNAHLLSSEDSTGGWFKLQTTGNLSIAGDTCKVKIVMKVRKVVDGIYRLIGSKTLTMKQFGIIPPTHFFGLIRAHEGLTVHFDLLAAKSSVSEYVVHTRELR